MIEQRRDTSKLYRRGVARSCGKGSYAERRSKRLADFYTESEFAQVSSTSTFKWPYIY
ncbi:hypothetical protein [Evansella cellulosilytica]|uniref:Uncharacterized protein n=1 Tax=Evansella cellulosilytica (strain ATCC 21833 / DSM 2522 / FERM P-1141 / JCM 9156 / N-4) TaxID=649639 RepID=E6TXN7_EVAC2|nr:hypothetical protein [Evansella cellulosilytica]ADU29963.1 hypothetical protein Bcell_1700 [Evansella cellulosilytica DSM 2522]